MRFREKQFFSEEQLESTCLEWLFTSINWLEIFTVLELFSDALNKMERLFNNLHITVILRPLCMLEEAMLKDSASERFGQIVTSQSALLFEEAPDR